MRTWKDMKNEVRKERSQMRESVKTDRNKGMVKCGKNEGIKEE